MGKCKQRLLAKAKNDKMQLFMTRVEALYLASRKLEKNPTSASAKKLISLFGLSGEELAEAGTSYEVLRSLDCVINLLHI